jgi:AcrR family transcriptional regulator
LEDIQRSGSLPIWAMPEPSGRRPRLSRDQIAAAAIAIADADGFDAVSMRRIAAALGAGTMSLYRYITTKADLLALLDDALLAEALVPMPLPADWRAALTLVARHTRAAYLRHPWAAQSLHGRPVAQAATAGPNSLAHLEQSLAALANAPMDAAARLDLLTIVDDYVIGHVLRAAEVSERIGSPSASPETTAASADRLASDGYPHIAGLAGQLTETTAGDAGRLGERFELGLRLLIDGVAAQYPTR